MTGSATSRPSIWCAATSARCSKRSRPREARWVKTIGDAVMATFPTPDRALRAAMRMREAMRKINEERGGDDLALNIGLHSGPCLAVMLDDRQDYFGQTVNIASRVNELADPTAILATKPIIDSSEVARVSSKSSCSRASRGPRSFGD